MSQVDNLPKDMLIKLLLICEKEIRNKKVNAFQCYERGSIYFLSYNWHFRIFLQSTNP